MTRHHDEESGGAKRRRRKRLRKLKVLPRRPVASRRRFVVLGVTFLAAGAALSGRLLRAGARVLELPDRKPIRPPTAALDDGRFQSACIRCGLCGTVCENGCIRTFGVDEDRWGALTPYLDIRRRSCTLCMRCTNICPTGALTPVEDRLEVIVEQVDMGTAVVDPDRCLSYLGRVCGYCYDACPLPGDAIVLTPPASPVVIADACVGCGRCVELCPQSPTAIDVFRHVAEETPA